jgi:hypothetical protein
VARAFLRHLAASDFAKFSVDKGKESIERRAIAFTPIGK